ncbi:hypothetical protein [Frankia sp. AgB32]|uniref:hypothetical protein n=1 Tax=Frankia sp. AgB32 TaxID=631119 RepID=UPI00200BF83B|nr:hypothetical protein [Frankia sp. AgB32]MCK9896566.1 hypothetical protein [Frankia sp. AgB32]
MTTHDADLNRPLPPRRDDDFFAVERVGEPEQPGAAPSPAPSWGPTPWTPAPGEAPAAPAESRRSADPFDVTSTWNGPAPRFGSGAGAISVDPPDPAPAPAAPPAAPGGALPTSHLPSIFPPARPGPGPADRGAGTGPGGDPRSGAGLGGGGAFRADGAPGQGGPSAYSGPSAYNGSVAADESAAVHGHPSAYGAPAGYDLPPVQRVPPPHGTAQAPAPRPAYPSPAAYEEAPSWRGPATGSVRVGAASPDPAPRNGDDGGYSDPFTGGFPISARPVPAPGARTGAGPSTGGLRRTEAPAELGPPPPSRGSSSPGSPSPGHGFGAAAAGSPLAATGGPSRSPVADAARMPPAQARPAGEPAAPRPVDPWNGHSSPRLWPVPGPSERSDPQRSDAAGQVTPYPSTPPRGFGADSYHPTGPRGTNGAAPSRAPAAPALPPVGGAVPAAPALGRAASAVPPAGPGEVAPGRGRGAGPPAGPAQSWDPVARDSGWRNPLTDTGSFVRPAPPPGPSGSVPEREDPLSGPLPVVRRRSTGPASPPDGGTGWRTPGAPPVDQRSAALATRRGQPATPDRRSRPEPAPGTGRSPGPPARRVEETMTTARPLYREDAPGSGSPPGARPGTGGPSGPGEAAGASPRPGRAAGGAPDRRPETPAEMTSLVSRRAGGRGGALAPPGDGDSGWQPSRSVRRTGARSVPADRRRTPNPVTDTNSLQPVASTSGDREATGGPEERGAETGERRRRTGARGSATGSGGRRATGARTGEVTGSHAVPRRRADHRHAASSALLEPTDRSAGPLDDEDEPLSADGLAWLRQGWIGPLAVALVVALLGVGGFVLLRGHDGGGAAPAATTAADVSANAVATNPDALAGKAMIDGSWQCRLVTATNPLKLSTDVVGVLVVARTDGAYTWQGSAGQYTITAVAGNDGGNVIGDVKFTSGPLKDLTGTHIAKPGGGIRGRAQGTLELKASGAAQHRFCGVN